MIHATDPKALTDRRYTANPERRMARTVQQKAIWNKAIDEAVTAMWHSYTEGPEAMEVLMDKLKEQA